MLLGHNERRYPNNLPVETYVYEIGCGLDMIAIVLSRHRILQERREDLLQILDYIQNS